MVDPTALALEVPSMLIQVHSEAESSEHHTAAFPQSPETKEAEWIENLWYRHTTLLGHKKE